jgi:hypothetical protein
LTGSAPEVSRERSVFEGFIMGVGSTSGIRLVVGIWARSPLGAFVDVMVELPGGHRILLAPTAEVGGFVGDVYTFDETRIQPVRVARTSATVTVTAADLRLTATVAGRTVLGQLLSVVPRQIAGNALFAASADQVARRVLPGVRTYGTTGEGLREWYSALDEHRVTALAGRFDGTDLGDLRPVRPPVRFGFGSVPPQPSLVRLLSTVERERSDES